MHKFRDSSAWRYENRDVAVDRTPWNDFETREASVSEPIFSKNVGISIFHGGSEVRSTQWDRKMAKPAVTESRLSLWQSDSEEERKGSFSGQAVSPVALFEYQSIWDPTHVSSEASSSDTSSSRSTPSPDMFEPLPSPPSAIIRGPHAPVPLYTSTRRYTEPAIHIPAGGVTTSTTTSTSTGGAVRIEYGQQVVRQEISCSPSTLQMEEAMHQLGKEITNKLFVTPPVSPQMLPLQANLPQNVASTQLQTTQSTTTKPTGSTQTTHTKREVQLTNLPIVQRKPEISDFEWEIILHMCNILWKNGWISVGRMGSFLHTATQNHDLPKVFKQRYGGLKKFVALFPQIFDLADDHPFNPSLFMKACPQELITAATAAGNTTVGNGSTTIGTVAGACQTVGSVLMENNIPGGNPMLLNQSDDIGMNEEELIEIICDVLKSNASVSVGRMGTTIVSKTQNHRLPRYFKSKYGGLKRFFESKSDIFVLGDDHPFNPIVYLKSEMGNAGQSVNSLPLQCDTAFPAIGAKSPKETSRTPPAQLEIPPRPTRLVYQKMYGGPTTTTAAAASNGYQKKGNVPPRVQRMFVPKQKIQSAPILTKEQMKNSSFAAFPRYTGSVAQNSPQVLQHNNFYRSNSVPASPVNYGQNSYRTLN